jgi:creatinine amidohydrolase
MEKKNYLDYMVSKPAELEEQIAESPIAYIPFGALEWHGEHMVLGNDSIKASFLCKKTVELTGGVLFPCVNYGAFDTVNFPYTLHFSKKNLVQNTRKMMGQLYSMGFKIVILLTGHYPGAQMKNVRKAAQKFTKKYSDGFALGIPEQALVPDFGYLGDHAAEWETSILMAINPEYVDLTRIGKGLRFSERCVRHCIMGRDPIKHASIEKGREVIEQITTRLAKSIQEVRANQSADPFNRIYENYDKAMKEMFNLKNPFKFDKLFELQGIEGRHEALNYVKWKLFRRGRQKKSFVS